MVLGPLLGAGVGLAEALMGMGARQDATNLQYLNLYETRRANRKQEAETRRVNDLIEALQTATRSDALGNKTSYNRGANAFETDLTPLTQAILDNQQNEQLRQFTEDAPRNRAAAERQDRRSQMADNEFERRFNEYRFRPQQSEAASISEATEELLRARREGLRDAQGDIATTLLRQGNSSNLPAVTGEISERYSDSLRDAILEGKRVGSQRYREREAADQSQLLTELSQLRGMADDVTTSPVGRSNAAEQLTGRADHALQALVSALQSGGNNLANVIGQGADRSSNAYSNLSRSVAQSTPDLSSVASLLARLSFGDEQSSDDPSMSEYDPWAGLRQVTV